MRLGIVTDWLGGVFESDGAGAAVAELNVSRHGVAVALYIVAVK